MKDKKYKVTKGLLGYYVTIKDDNDFAEGPIIKRKDAAEYRSYCEAKADINEPPFSYEDFLEFNKSAN